MNATRLVFSLLLLSSAAMFQLTAQQAETARESIEEIKIKAKSGDPNSQFELGLRYGNGEGVTKDPVEAVKWFRKAAEQNLAEAQYNLSISYDSGQGVTKDHVEAVRWLRKAAELGLVEAQYNLGVSYVNGQGVTKNQAEAVKWFRKAAFQNYADAQYSLGICYNKGQGVTKNQVEAATWFRKAAEQNHPEAQYNLSLEYGRGEGVTKDYVEAYKWCVLSAGQGNEPAKRDIDLLEEMMTREQIAEGQKLARDFKPRKTASSVGDNSSHSRPIASGSGFFISEDGFLITNEHVAASGARVRLLTAAGMISAKVVKVDAANDLALLKAEGTFRILAVVTSRSVRLGDTVATVGFPNIGLQGFAPKFARGEIGSLTGPRDDARYFQISVPVQPGNSGGALVDEHGNVVGVVSAKLSARAALASSGALPENVNYAVKSSFLLSFLESVPEVAAKLKDPNTKEMKFADVVEEAKGAAVLVLVY